jgi:hypothetical protein
MEVLKFINEQMHNLNIPYEFGEWTSPVVYPYFVGEVQEDEPLTEDGAETSSFTLTGFHRGEGGYTALGQIKTRLKRHFDTITGLTVKRDGYTITCYYANAFFIPTNEADLKRIQINLKIKLWKGVI